MHTQPGTALEQAWPRRRRHIAIRLAIVAALILLLSSGVLAYEHSRRFFTITTPPVAHVDVWDVLFHSPSFEITVGGHAAAAPWRATADEIVSSRPLWQRMHIADWNNVPAPLLERGLDALLREYEPVLMTPAVWDRMTAHDWDDIPQPIRVIAYRQMVAYWAGFYGVGKPYGLPPGRVTDTLAAIVMSESWFDHRAGCVYEDGSRDVGLGQASDYARDRLRRLHQLGRVDAAIDDEEYVNPWQATRFVALWMALMLDEAQGDLDLAVRAYNRGIARAHDALGDAYLATVRQRLTRYIRNVDAPPAWDYLWRRARALEREAWSWIDGRGAVDTDASTPAPPRS